MPKTKQLTEAYLSALFLELSLILRAGMPLGSGLALLREDDDDAASRVLLSALLEQTDKGESLSAAMEHTGAFPEHALRMVALAERTGRLEQTLVSLSDYYENRRQLRRNVYQTLMYPALLLLVFLAVVTVLVTKVLPIFENVFRQLGAQLSAPAQAMLTLGRRLSDASVGLGIAAGCILVLLLAFLLIRPLRRRTWVLLYSRFGGTGVWGSVLRSRFAGALATAIASGLDARESVDAAAKQVQGALRLDRAVENCRHALEQGESLHKALADAGLFGARDSRMIAMGFQTGSIDQVMAEIAQRTQRQANERLESIIAAVEPTVVVLTALVAGVILLSVMLPLMGVMSGMV